MLAKKNIFMTKFTNKTVRIYSHLHLIKKFVFLKKKSKLMKNKPFLKDCKCLHCKKKLAQINNSRLYWDKIILIKN